MTASNLHSPRCGPRMLVAKTCVGCDELKMAAEFLRVTKPNTGWAYWTTYCRACNRRRTREIVRRANDASLEKATHHNDIWSSDEIETLWRLDRQGLSHRLIGERLGRTELSVQMMKAKTRVIEKGVRLCYYNPRTDAVRVIDKTFDPAVKGHDGRLNRAAQELTKLHPQLIFFIEIEGGGEYMGIRGLDVLKQGDDREPEDSAEDLEVLTHPSQNEN